MTRSIFAEPDPAGEPGVRMAFAGNRLDRQSENRPPDCLERALADPRSLAFAFAGGRLVARTGEDRPAALHRPALLDALQPDPDCTILLGFSPDGAARLAVALAIDPDNLPEEMSAIPMRAVYTQGLLSGETLGEAAQAAALVNWSLATRFCGICGTRTVGEAGGYRRRCPSTAGGCGNLIFPRTDPVVIMLAIDEARQRCLLGRSPHFSPGVYSCLAGFLEPGETMEDAVRRETLEESGIAIARVRYHASQPWPMPHTVMIGFYGEAASFDIDHDGEELEDCRWFTRTQAADLLERRPEAMTTAPDGAIANLLLRDWLARGAG